MPPEEERLRSRTSDVGEAIERHFSTEDAASLASIDRPPSKEEVKQPAATVFSSYSIEVLALLAPASIFGVLARLGLLALVKYDGDSIFTLAYPQALGCLFMGMALMLKEPLGNFYGPLYTAFTTGFCGSLTTFSSWQLDVFNSWVNSGHYHRDWLRDVIDGCTKIFFTLSIAWASLAFGVHFAHGLLPYIPILRPPSKPVRYILLAMSVLMYAATIVTYFELSTAFRHQVTAALLFCYPGTLTRYLLSINLNPRLKTLPLGTLAANLLGTALLGVFHVLQGLPTPLSANSCSILQGLADGYCGCLTTVSTFAAEISALTIRRRYIYGTVTIVCGQLLMLVIMGSSFWAGGVNDATAGTCRYP
ncbi:hypothetical protein PENSPDRAFT_568386 [Peniophora sp. CONT]|nr:hypothetical protein PENSPDRAFT_568386 [Peniophora sp. CONT]